MTNRNLNKPIKGGDYNGKRDKIGFTGDHTTER